MNIDKVHWNLSDNGTKEPAKIRFWNFCNFWTAWKFLMRFSLLYSGECVFIYIGVSTLIRKRKNKLTNGHGGMVIQFRAAIFERIRNVQIKPLQTVFISLLSVAFSCILHRYWRHIAYNDVTRDSVTCSVTANRYVKYPEHIFAGDVSFIEVWRNFLNE